MSFFDPREQVISIVLTNYGKYLLSRGKFKPFAYEIFDDDVLYDSQFARVIIIVNKKRIKG